MVLIIVNHVVFVVARVVEGNDADYCLLLALGIYLELWLIDGRGSSALLLFADDVTITRKIVKRLKERYKKKFLLFFLTLILSLFPVVNPDSGATATESILHPLLGRMGVRSTRSTPVVDGNATLDARLIGISMLSNSGSMVRYRRRCVSEVPLSMLLWLIAA